MATPVSICGIDTNGVVREIAVGTDGQLQINLTGEGLALDVSVDTLETATGIVTETAPATDTASSGLNGRLQRVAQRLTSLLALVPASLGQKADAASLAVTLSTEQAALLSPNTTAATGIAPVVTSALATGKVIKASAGNLYSLNCAATTVAGSFLLHNSATVPAAGAVTPVKVWPVAIGQGIELRFDPPLRLGTGVSVSFTIAATPFTQTDSATAFIGGEAV